MDNLKKKAQKCKNKKSKSKQKKVEPTEPDTDETEELPALESRKIRESCPPLTPLRPSGRVADWDDFLELPENIKNIRRMAQVSMFKHAPLVDIWDTLTAHQDSMVFEVPNSFQQAYHPRPVNWFARIIVFAGYKCLIEFDNLGTGQHYFCWASFCSDVLKHVGYSRKNKIKMCPPFVATEMPDYLERGFARVAGKRTVAENHSDLITAGIRSRQKFRLEDRVEFVDTEKLSETKIGTIKALVGDRVLVFVSSTDQLVCSVHSELVHPIGWSHTVGHDIYGIPPSVKFNDLDSSYFPKYPSEIVVEVGQFLEARLPSKPHLIVAARICKILKHGYFYVISKTTATEETNPSKYAYHITSPYIFACGFCKEQGIELIPPYGESPSSFSWTAYLNRWNGKTAPLELLPEREKPKFIVGMKMEAVDETSPAYLGPATILDIKAHLLRIHFDGWTTSKVIQAEHWIEFQSPNLYPAGYAEMVGHAFEGRVEPEPIANTTTSSTTAP